MLYPKTKKQKEQVLESHIFVEEKRDGTIKAQKMIGGNKQRDYITKEDVSSPTVTAEAVMLTCIIDAQEEGRDVAVVDIPNAFVQTVVSKEDAEHHVTVHIRDHWLMFWCQLHQMSMACMFLLPRLGRRC
jgi:hypothetical protein